MAKITQHRLPEHPDQAALLAYLDKDGDPADRSHIDRCTHCQSELEHIQCIRQALRELPPQQPPAHLWHNIQEHGFQPPQHKPFVLRQSMTWLSMAASLLLVAVVVLIQLPDEDKPAIPELAALIEENQQLEAALARLESQPSVMRLDAIGQITLLKDSVSAVDMAFSSQFDQPDNDATKADLLEKRIQLMRELVEKRAQPMLAYSSDYHTF